MRRRTHEDTPNACFPCLLIGKSFLVCLETCETNSHLGDDARKDCSETLVECERSFTFDDVSPGRDEPSSLRLRRAMRSDSSESVRRNSYPTSARSRQLHANLDGIERLAC